MFNPKVLFIFFFVFVYLITYFEIKVYANPLFIVSQNSLSSNTKEILIKVNKNIEEGKESFKSKNFNQAIDYFDSAILDINDNINIFKKIKPNSYVNNVWVLDISEAFVFRGCSVFFLEDYIRAKEDFSSILTNPIFSVEVKILAEKLIQYIDYKINVLNYIKNGQIYYNNGEIWKSIDSFSDAVRYSEIAYERNPGGIFAKNQCTQEIALSFKKNLIEAYTKRVNAYIKNKNFHKATDDFSELMRLDPSNGNFYSQSAAMYELWAREVSGEESTEKYKIAKEDYLKACQLGIDLACQLAKKASKNENKSKYSSLEFYENNIEKLINQKEYAEAIKLATAGLNKFKNSSYLWRARSIAYQETGQLKKALFDANQAIDCQNNMTGYNLWQRADVYKVMGNCNQSNNDYLNACVQRGPGERHSACYVYWCGESKSNITQSILKSIKLAQLFKAKQNHKIGRAYHSHYIGLLNLYVEEFGAMSLINFMEKNYLNNTKSYNGI